MPARERRKARRAARTAHDGRQSGRNNEAVKQYMARRWSNEFPGKRDIQAQLMAHLDYALEHTDWHAQLRAVTAMLSAAGPL